MLRAQADVIRQTVPAWPGRAALASLREPAELALHAVILFGGYYVAGVVGLSFRFEGSQIGVVWPPNAVFMCALLLAPRSRWWFVIAVTATAHMALMLPEVPAWRWLWQIVGNSIFAAATAEALRRFARLPLRFECRHQVLLYMAITFATSAIFGFTTPAFVRSLLGLEPAYHPFAALQRTILSNATGLLLVGPVILLWAQRGLQRFNKIPAGHFLEACAILAAVVGLSAVAFATGHEFTMFPSLLLWLFPPLLWAAVRFGPLGASTAILCVAALSLSGTMRQLGPFVPLPEAEKVLALQLLWIGLCAPVMLLAAIIREREQIEDALHEQRNHLAHVTRVATAGEMSGALAHELRQPLMAVLANAQAALQLLQRSRIDRWELRAMLEDIVQENRQAANVISRLRDFLTEGDTKRAPVPVETVVRDALALGRSTIELAGVDVQTEIAPDLPLVRGDHVQLLQVVLNLIVNGCESMAANERRERSLRLDLAPADPHHVVLRVADCGVGLPPGGEDRVFEAFYTTKEKGLGLGLAIGRSIATAHGGRLWAENNRHGGATFHLLLPKEGARDQGHAVDRHS